MEINTIFLLVAGGTAFLFILLYLYERKRRRKEEKRCEEILSQHRSTLVKHGQKWEHFVPFMTQFEEVGNKENFVFLGSPIDGVCFDEDFIKFIEVKTGTSQLSEKQKRIRDLVEKKKVRWYELRF